MLITTLTTITICLHIHSIVAVQDYITNYQNIVASSILQYNNHSFDPGNVVDKNNGTLPGRCECCWSSNSERNPTIHLLLQHPTVIGFIEILGRTDDDYQRLSGINILIDGQNRTTHQHYDNSNNKVTVLMPPERARNITLNRPRPSGVWILTICEIKVYRLVNVADRALITVSSTWTYDGYNYTAENVIDGSNQTTPGTCDCCWLSQNEVTPWLSIQLKENSPVVFIEIIGRSDFKDNAPMSLSDTSIIVDGTDKSHDQTMEGINVYLAILPSTHVHNITVLRQRPTGQNEWFLNICEIKVFSLVCADDRFGVGCNHTCHCFDNKTCNSMTGECQETGCYAGWHGTACDQECASPVFGNGCSDICHCINGTHCDHVTGHCDNGACEPGWHGESCIQACGELQPRPYVNITYDSGTDYDSVVIFTCPLGMRSNGSKTSRCEISGMWSHPVPTCFNISCSDPEIPQNGFISLLSNHTYLFNQTITIGCDSGYTLQGFTSRICQANGQWSGYVPECSMGEVQPRECSRDIDTRGTVWNKTTAGQISSKQCISGYHGTITRVCTVDGRWLLPLYNCVRKTIEEIGQVVAGILEAPTEKLVDEVLSKLTQETGVSDTVSLQDGEIILVTDILGNIATASRNVTINKKQQENFFEIASNLVDERTFNSWKAIAQDDTGNDTRVDGVMKAVEDYADAIVFSSQPSKDIEINRSNIVFSISNMKNRPIEDLNFPKPTLRKESFYVLPRQALKDVKYSLSVYYETLGQILPAYNKERTISEETSINSAVLALKLIPYLSELNSPLTITFEHLTDELDSPTCSYWDFTTNGWGSDGCYVKQTTKNMTQCECSHLTNFAVLMSPYRQGVSQTLSMITLVGSTISLVLLGVTLVMHVFLWRYVKSDRVVMLMNLVVALTISYLLFIFGVEETGNKTVCTTIAVVLHYFLLLVFFMMLCVTVDIAISVNFVLGSKQRRSVILLPIGWGVPVVIVTTSALISNLDGYGTSDYCWLSIEDGLIWAFVGPAIFVISVNLILLVVILKRMFSTRFMAHKSGMEKIRATMRSVCVLLPVMGITWIFGVFYINEDTQWIQYLFAVCNSLQGVVVFIFHCALNKQIHSAVRRTRRKYSVATSSDKISKPRTIETHSV